MFFGLNFGLKFELGSLEPAIAEALNESYVTAMVPLVVAAVVRICQIMTWWRLVYFRYDSPEHA
jgi:hypothetical protein